MKKNLDFINKTTFILLFCMALFSQMKLFSRVEANWRNFRGMSSGPRHVSSISNPNHINSVSRTYNPGLGLFAHSPKDSINQVILLVNKLALNPSISNTYFLPIELTNLSVTCIADHQAKIKWTTYTEINCDSFLLYRSTNRPSAFSSPIARVKGSVNSYTVNQYEFVDKNLEYDSIYYYMLEQVDLDKTAHRVGPIVNTTCLPVFLNYFVRSLPTSKILSTVNKENKVLSISSNQNYDNVTIEVYTIFGQKILTLNNVNLKNGEAFNIDVNSIDANFFIIKIF